VVGALGCNAIVGVEDVELKKAAAAPKKNGTSSSSSSGGDENDGSSSGGPNGVPTPADEGDNSGTVPGSSSGTTTPATKPECNGATNCERIAFVTRAKFTGNLGGLVGADQKCVEAAKAIPGLGGRAFRAWLSDSLTSARTRLPKGTSAYRRTDKGVVATSFVDLSDGSVALPLALDEKGVMLAADTFERTVWTGTATDGTANELTCRDWTSADLMDSALFGDSHTTDDQWTQSATSSCNAQRHLYCIEY